LAIPLSEATTLAGTFAIAFTGIRGVVSLAAALSIPLTLPDGQPFPERNTVLFITFCVILTTLLGQGSLLPLVFQKLGLVERGRREQELERRREAMARIEAAKAPLARLDGLRQEELPADLAQALRSRHEDRVRGLERYQESDGADDPLRERGEVERQLIEAERARIERLRREGPLSDEARRRIERELDFEEARIVQAGRDPA
jgi:monovalent cation/hydrogen antiporter